MLRNIIVWVISIFLISCDEQSIEQTYYPNGVIKTETNYSILGRKNGMSKKYYNNGKIEHIAYFRDDTLIGQYLQYDSLGNLFLKYNFKNGKQNGENLDFYPNGKVKYRINYKDDILNGKFYEYYEDGKPHIVKIYRDGKQKYALAITPEGRIYGEYLAVKITPKEKVTYYELNKEYHLDITIEETNYENSNLGVIIGSLDEELKLVDTIEALRSKNLHVDYSFIPTKVGKQKITGRVYEIEVSLEDTIGGVRAESPFVFEYEVR